jgi:3-oxoacyl-[acyl-carrier-protein] synthase II
VTIDPQLSITGLGALSALGTDISSHHESVIGKHVPFRHLGELLGNDSPHAARPIA